MQLSLFYSEYIFTAFYRQIVREWTHSKQHLRHFFFFFCRSAQQAQNNAAQAAVHAAVGVGVTHTETSVAHLEVQDIASNHNYGDGNDFPPQNYNFAGY